MTSLAAALTVTVNAASFYCEQRTANVPPQLFRDDVLHVLGSAFDSGRPFHPQRAGTHQQELIGRYSLQALHADDLPHLGLV